MSDHLIKVHPCKEPLSFVLPRSKSYATRLLILAARSAEPVTIKNLPDSSDVRFLLNAFPALGIKVQENSQEVVIEGPFPYCEKVSDETIELETGDGGTTNRFLAVLLSLGKNRYRLNCSVGFRKRPSIELQNVLNELQVDFDNWVVQGPCRFPVQLEVDCSESTQFFSALKLSLSGYQCSLRAKNIQGSHRYLELTDYLVEEFSHKKVWDVPLDFSSLGPLVSMAIYERRACCIVDLLAPDPLQADYIFLEFLEKLGIELAWRPEGLCIHAKMQKLKAFEFNGEESPDLVPSLVFLACGIAGQSRLWGLQRLKLKESNRLDWILRLLTLFQIDHEYDADQDLLCINGQLQIKKSAHVIHCPEDHRVIMLAWNFCRAAGEGRLINIDNIKKSFPNFFEAYK